MSNMFKGADENILKDETIKIMPNQKKYHLILIGDDIKLIDEISACFKSVCFNDFKIDEESFFIDINPDHVKRYKDLICCVYFGSCAVDKYDSVFFTTEFLKYSIPVIPVAKSDKVFSTYPECLKSLNSIIEEKESMSVCQIILNTVCRFFGLIRKERRVFISYARRDSRKVALQLFDKLSQRGYNVFLDTASIDKGDIFQDELWHQMADSDLVIMLNTMHYTGSRWCTEEYINALSCRIGILSISWPEVVPSNDDAWKLTGQYKLEKESLTKGGLLRSRKLKELLYLIESMRISNLASRKTLLIREFICVEENKGHAVYYDAVNNIIHGSDDDYLPVVGVPKSEQFNEVRKKDKPLNILYSSDMIRKDWRDYLEWINSFNLPVRTHGIMIQVRENK